MTHNIMKIATTAGLIVCGMSMAAIAANEAASSGSGDHELAAQRDSIWHNYCDYRKRVF